jgi:signal transduction histidine kinase
MTRHPLQLRVWSALAAAAIGLLCAGVVLGTEAWSGNVVLGAVVGIVAALLMAGAAMLVGARVAQSVRALRIAAVTGLQDPAASLSGAPEVLRLSRGATEMLELTRTLQALQMRVRTADEIAERHRRTAELATAGVAELLSGLVAAEESARGQLAAELHDTVAQSLATARRQLAEGVDAVGCVEEAEEQIRAVMARTRPPALRDGDLAAAVTILCDDMTFRYGLQVECDWPAEAYPLPLATAITVYRFFQEGLLNVVKHADVDNAMIALKLRDDVVVALVADAGVGFDQDSRPSSGSSGGRHVGLGLLRERARLAGGGVELRSADGAGTMLTLRLPLRPMVSTAQGRVA